MTDPLYAAVHTINRGVQRPTPDNPWKPVSGRLVAMAAVPHAHRIPSDRSNTPTTGPGSATAAPRTLENAP